MSLAVSDSELDNMVFNDELSKIICKAILGTIKLEEYGIILSKYIYQKLVKVLIIDNENKDLNLIKAKINKLFEPLSLNCWITFTNNNGKIIYKINFNMEYITDENLNNINIYTCLNMIKNYINNSNDIKEIKIPVKLYNYLMIYISKQKEKHNNYFDTEYQEIVEFFSDNKIDLLLINKTSNVNDKDYYEIIFSKFDTNDENSIKSTSNKDDLITNNTTNFPTLTDNQPTQDLKTAINYGKIKDNWYDDNGSVEEEVIDDVKEEVIDDIKEEVINDVKEEVIDDVKEEVIDDVKEEVIDDVKEEVIDDVKEEVIDDDKEDDINDVLEEVLINKNKESINNQTISGAFCQGQLQLSGDIEHDNYIFTMNGIKDGNNLNLHFSITGLCDENNIPIRIPVKINFPFDEAVDNRNVMFSPVPNNF